MEQFYERISKLTGKQVVVWEDGDELKDPANTIYHLGCLQGSSEDGTNEGLYRLGGSFANLVNQPNVDQVTGLLLVESADNLESSDRDIEELVLARSQLPHLKAIFLGDIDINQRFADWYWQHSWIPFPLCDVSPLFNAYPHLECLQILSGNGIGPDLGTLQNASHLKALIVQTNGLSANTARQIATADLPALEYLEVYVGTHDYGGNTTLEDITPMLVGEKFPKLKYLGLRNCDEFTDELAKAISQSPMMSHLEVLDLSLGSLSDEGAQALLDCPYLCSLKKLDIHFHFCSEAMMDKLKALPIEVDVSDPNADEGFRYCAISE